MYIYLLCEAVGIYVLEWSIVIFVYILDVCILHIHMCIYIYRRSWSLEKCSVYTIRPPRKFPDLVFGLLIHDFGRNKISSTVDTDYVKQKWPWRF